LHHEGLHAILDHRQGQLVPFQTDPVGCSFRIALDCLIFHQTCWCIAQ